MSLPLASAAATCSICGEPLNAKGDCLACLLRTGIDKSGVEDEPPASLAYGDFEIVRREDGSLWELGRGAFGVTYLAVDNVLRRKVALKVIEVPAAARGSQPVRERFLREARAAAALRHPNVAAVFQFGASPDGNRCYYAMELIEGETLEARVRRDGPLNAKLVLEIAIQITRALMAAAAQGLIHRDLKPANIMLSDKAELEAKVIDFGLAKAIADAGGEMDLTHGEFVGTPNFASPEQFESRLVDVRSDIYSLGATLWFALTGKTPFAGRNIDEIRRAQKSDALPIEQLKTAHVPSHLGSLLESMLAFEPAARPGAHDLLKALKDLRRNLEFESFVVTGFFEELKRRKVYRVAAAYIIAAVGIIQLASAAFPAWELPNWALRLVIVLLLIGFPLALVLGWVFDVTPQGIRATPRAGPGTHRRLNVIMLVAAGVIISATAGFFLLPRVSADKVDKSIAVLPFDNQNRDPDTDYLSDGIPESIIHSLSQVAQLKVMARSTVFQYKGKDVDPRKVGHDLGVGAVLMGRLVQQGDNLTIRTELVNVSDGMELWGQQYNRKLADVFAVQEEIAKEITEKLRVKLTGPEQQQLAKRPTENLKAFQYYMQSRAFIQRSTREDLLTAIRYCEKAVEEDRNYALAYAGLADAYLALGPRGYVAPIEGRRKAEGAAREALAFDDNLAEAHAALGASYALFSPADFSLADRELRRAIELSPSLAFAHHYLALSFVRRGRLDEGLEEFLKARQLDPLSSIIARNVALPHYIKRDYVRAHELLRRANELGPALSTSWEIGVYIQNRLFDEALAELEKAKRERKNDSILIYDTGMVYAAQGKRAEALQAIKELEQISGSSLDQAHLIAKIYATLNDKELAFEWLERGLSTGAIGAFHKDDPVWDPIRSDPWFTDLLRRMGIPQ